MLGSAFFIVGTLAFLCVDPSSAITQSQANSVCALLPDGENIANPDDCTQYFSCSKGKAFLHSCLGSNLYSKDYQGCVPPSQSSCGSTDTDPCALMADGYFASVRNSCREFYFCQNGKGQKSSCENGLNFDEVNQSCQYAADYPCQESIPGEGKINVCEVVRSGIYFGVASSCNAWQKCQVNGPREIGDCDSPYVFNVDTQSCDWKENVNCRQLQGDSETGGPSLEGQTCDTNGEVRPDTTCSGYYVCTNGKFAFGKCINGQYFDTKTNQCVSRLDAINDCDRCEGTKLQFVNIVGDGCTGYGVCENGKMQSISKCSTGFFSEISGGCIRNGKNPGFPVCQIPEEEPTEPPIEKSTTESDDTSSTSTSTSTSKSTKSTSTTKQKTTTSTVAPEEPAKSTEEPEDSKNTPKDSESGEKEDTEKEDTESKEKEETEKEDTESKEKEESEKEDTESKEKEEPEKEDTEKNEEEEE